MDNTGPRIYSRNAIITMLDLAPQVVEFRSRVDILSLMR